MVRMYLRISIFPLASSSIAGPPAPGSFDPEKAP